MIRIKSFEISKADEASEFMANHTPLTTEKSPGIQLNMGYIVIMYDDGIFNYKNVVDKFRNLVGKEIETIEVSKHDIKRNNHTIQELKPKGYKKTLTDKELLVLCQAEGDDYKTAGNRVAAIIEVENKNLMAAKTVQHCLAEIKLFEQTLESYGNLPQGTVSVEDMSKIPTT